MTTRRYFRQSWINTFLMCPEQARIEWYNPSPESHTDATAIGTAMHAGIETTLKTGNPSRGQLAVVAEWERLEPMVRYVQVKRSSTALTYATNCFQAWWQEVYPHLGQPVSIERKFKVDIDDRVGLKGTWDFLDDSGTLWDWKTSNRPYEEWEKKRYAVQPTAYGSAAVLLGELEWPVNFCYSVSLKASTIQPTQIIPVERHQGHLEWLTAQLHRMADLLDATDAGLLEHWPLNDQGWHCSPKWCDHWDTCKGAFVDRPTPPPIADGDDPFVGLS